MQCPSCGAVVLRRTDMLNERLEYVSSTGNSRPFVTTMRVICANCARTISDAAKAGGDFPAFAAFEVVAKLQAYLAMDDGQEGEQVAWEQVIMAMDRYTKAEQGGLF